MQLLNLKAAHHSDESSGRNACGEGGAKLPGLKSSRVHTQDGLALVLSGGVFLRRAGPGCGKHDTRV